MPIGSRCRALKLKPGWTGAFRPLTLRLTAAALTSLSRRREIKFAPKDRIRALPLGSAAVTHELYRPFLAPKRGR